MENGEKRDRLAGVVTGAPRRALKPIWTRWSELALLESKYRSAPLHLTYPPFEVELGLVANRAAAPIAGRLVLAHGQVLTPGGHAAQA